MLIKYCNILIKRNVCLHKGVVKKILHHGVTFINSVSSVSQVIQNWSGGASWKHLLMNEVTTMFTQHESNEAFMGHVGGEIYLHWKNHAPANVSDLWSVDSQDSITLENQCHIELLHLTRLKYVCVGGMGVIHLYTYSMIWAHWSIISLSLKHMYFLHIHYFW